MKAGALQLGHRLMDGGSVQQLWAPVKCVSRSLPSGRGGIYRARGEVRSFLTRLDQVPHLGAAGGGHVCAPVAAGSALQALRAGGGGGLPR